MDFVALRKIIVGISLLLIASGVIKLEIIQKKPWIRNILYVLGVLLILVSILYQFNIIPESSTDVLFKYIKEL